MVSKVLGVLKVVNLDMAHEATYGPSGPEVVVLGSPVCKSLAVRRAKVPTCGWRRSVPEEYRF